jgi:hypothetical protein
MEQYSREHQDDFNDEPHNENEPERERKPGRGKGVVYFIIAAFVIGAIAAGIWWAVVTFGGNSEDDVVDAVRGYFTAGALNDRETANMYVYLEEDREALRADDFTQPFDAETFFGFRAVQVSHHFSGEDGAYLYGMIEYNQRPSREFTAVLKERLDGNWGLLRLWLSEPLTDGAPASMLVGGARL